MNLENVKFKPVHYNYTVKDLEACLKFYKENLGWTVDSEINDKNGEWKIVYLKTGNDFQVELTTYFKWDETFKWELKPEFHLALNVDKKHKDELFALHKKNNVLGFVNEAMGIYFINDPEGNAIEIIAK